jgi:ankyrin repeat protein
MPARPLAQFDETPLLSACSAGQAACAALLVQRGANLSAKNTVRASAASSRMRALTAARMGCAAHPHQLGKTPMDMSEAWEDGATQAALKTKPGSR